MQIFIGEVNSKQSRYENRISVPLGCPVASNIGNKFSNQPFNTELTTQSLNQIPWPKYVLHMHEAQQYLSTNKSVTVKSPMKH